MESVIFALLLIVLGSFLLGRFLGRIDYSGLAPVPFLLAIALGVGLLCMGNGAIQTEAHSLMVTTPDDVRNLAIVALGGIFVLVWVFAGVFTAPLSEPVEQTG